MSPTTLTSLAILKVNVDQGNDYLEYLRPFILQILAEHRLSTITADVIKARIAEQFGLTIPEPTIAILLRRISRDHCITRDHGVYQIDGELPNPQLSVTTAEAERHISSVLNGLIAFSRGTVKQITTENHAVTAICTFLAEFGITCLRAYLRGSAIPSVEQTRHSDIVLVSKFVQHLRENEPERFDSFLVLLQGHMLANALMCPDLDKAPKTFREVRFYLDTPLIIHAIGADSSARKAAIIELISVLHNLGGKIVVFSHSLDEVRRVLVAAAESIGYSGTSLPSMPIVIEARKNGTTRSDLLLLIESLDDALARMKIEIMTTPSPIEQFQIDEMEFEGILTETVHYANPNAANYDVKSVRSIYALRGNMPIRSIEKCIAIFVTSNTLFAKAAWKYSQDYAPTTDVSSVITDFSLANTAWLKAPMNASALPKVQVLAFSYAALQPSIELLDKYMKEIDRLQNSGEITERDHQLLRSSPLVYDQLTDLTLGDGSELTGETIKTTLERVTREIKGEQREQIAQEQAAHQRTQENLTDLQEQYADLQKNSTRMMKIAWALMSFRKNQERVSDALHTERARNRKLLEDVLSIYHLGANIVAWICSGSGAIFLLLGAFKGTMLVAEDNLIASAASLVAGVLALLNLLFGTTLKRIHMFIRKTTLNALIGRLTKRTGIDLKVLDDNTQAFKQRGDSE